MSDVPLEVWEHRMDELVDKKLKPVTDDLQHLKTELLRTQRHLAHLNIRAIHDYTLRVLPNRRLSPQFTSELSTAFNRIDAPDEDPLSVAEQFEEKRLADLEKMGINYFKVTS
jgi:hypothetical protein